LNSKRANIQASDSSHETEINPYKADMKKYQGEILNHKKLKQPNK